MAAIIAPSPVMAEVQHDGHIYREHTLRVQIGTVQAGDVVEVLEDFSVEVYKVLTGDGARGWLAADKLNIPPDPPTDLTIPTPHQLEEYANQQGYASRSPHLLIVDVSRQKLYVFEGEAGAWRLTCTFACSTGMNISPTTRGTFRLTDRGDWFYSYRLESGAKYWIRFNNHYLLHTIPMDKNKNPIANEDVVGIRASNGCVRLMVDDMRWIYENIIDGTTIVIP